MSPAPTRSSASLLPPALLVYVLRARRPSLYRIDDYFFHSYPNIFLICHPCGALLDYAAVLELTTWFLVPMSVPAMLDDLLIRHLHRSQSESKLMSCMRVAYTPCELSQTNRQRRECEHGERHGGDG